MKWNGFSGSTIKLMALFFMLVDHTTAVLVQSDKYPALYETGRGIGRIAFPLFCFLLAEGFYHSKNVKWYLVRLLLFAFVSELPFNLAFRGTLFYPQHQNVFFTLFLGLLLLVCQRQLSHQFIKLGSIIVIFVTALLFQTDYSYAGVMLIYFFASCRDNHKKRFLGNVIFNSFLLQLTGIFSAIPMEFYNGKRGWRLKYVFYVFYPAHLLILYYIRFVLNFQF
ncbi:TraX family protein [Anaeromicropila populeti]|uniref:TraX protein n=1 Tax=Anaeromicropila populeti TaxID=37658 RepID=A0A1I6L2X3_9FIRM|nr:TraX family protein [Anaeromicropila populeti]SFR97638.1 TraX protein [Anaeromicropila populeti]